MGLFDGIDQKSLSIDDATSGSQLKRIFYSDTVGGLKKNGVKIDTR